MASYIFIFVLCIYINKIVKNALIIPKKKPVVTCVRVCCRNIIRLEPTIPDAIITRHSHQTELKLSINENANSAPNTPPMAAVCVEIFHHTLIMAQSICITNATISIDVIKCGRCDRFIRQKQPKQQSIEITYGTILRSF